MSALPKVLALVMILATMFGAGLQVDRAHLVATLRNYGLLARALLANFVLVPFVAVVLVRALHVDAGFAIGIVLMAMAPGVPFLANSAGRDGGGSLSFALTIAFCFAALSVVTIPITIALVLPNSDVAHVPVTKFLTTLVVFQLAPLLAGALIGPRLAAPVMEKLAKISHWIFLAAALGFLVLIFPLLVQSVSRVYGFGHLWIIVAVCVFSILAGWLLGGPDERYRRTLSIATLIRNVGLCLLIGTDKAFTGTLVVPTIFSYVLISFALSVPVRVMFKRTKARVAGA
jgi:bile acid:Na+ symporter, BASS family